MSRRAPTLLDLVSLAGAAVDDHVLQALESAGLPGLRRRHGYVVQRLLDGPRSVTALANELGVSQQAMSKTVAEMEAHGYLERRADPTDGRSRPVALSPRGREAVRQARAVRSALRRRLSARVEDADLRRTELTLRSLLDLLGLSDAVSTGRVPPPGEDR